MTEEAQSNIIDDTKGQVAPTERTASTLDEAYRMALDEAEDIDAEDTLSFASKSAPEDDDEDPEPEPKTKKKDSSDKEDKDTEEDKAKKDESTQIPNPAPDKKDEDGAEPETKLEPPVREKVKIKDSLGEVHEFESEDDVPEDFEPYSSAEGIRAAKAFAKAESDFERATEKYENDKEESERSARVDKIQEEWDNEVKQLAEDGFIPKEGEDGHKAIVDEVFEYMFSRSLVESLTFTSAYKNLMFDKQAEADKDAEANKAKEEAEKAKNDEKKKRGSMISGASRPRPSSVKKDTYNIPQGASLDDAYRFALGEITK